VAFIQAPEVLAQNEAIGPSQSPTPELYIRFPHGAPGEFYRAGRLKVIFPVIFYSESVRRATKQYLEIFWGGDDLGQVSDDKFFSMRIISEKQAKNIVGSL
jgi:hypothetical protein